MLELIDNNHLLLWVSFVFCLSLAAGGLLIIFRIGQSKQFPAFQYLQYFLILLYVFGFYSLWSRILLLQLANFDDIDRLSNIIAQLGIPFFIIALIMQLIWIIKIQEKPLKLYLISVLSIIAIIIIFLQWRWLQTSLIHSAYSLIGFILEFVILFILISGDKIKLRHNGKISLIILIACSGLIHLAYFTNLTEYKYYDTIFVYFFFLFNTAVTVVYTYTGESKKFAPSFEGFILKHSISKRETDIVQGIYAGKTNQEIADHLFITLQTVKDHSSRIYQKTFVKNRGQLVTLLRESL